MKLKRAGLITKIVVFVLIVYSAVTLIGLKTKIDSLQDKKDALQQEVTDKEISNAALEYELAHSDDDDTIADIARDELGLVAPGEIVFYDSGK
jgi:cell division protein FtsL